MGGIIMKEFNLEEYLKNPSQKVVTRDGQEVRIICTDAKGDAPIIALVYEKDMNKETPYTYNRDGLFYNNTEFYLDLFFAPIKKEGWINIYQIEKIYQCGNIHNTEEEALNCKGTQNYIKTIKIEWEE